MKKQNNAVISALIAAAVAASFLHVLGIFLRVRVLQADSLDWALFSSIGALATLITLSAIGFFRSVLLRKKLTRLSASSEDAANVFFSQRSDAEKNLAASAKKSRAAHRILIVLIIVYLLLSLSLALLSGLASIQPFVLFAILFCASPLCVVFTPRIESFADYAKPEDYPELYALAEKARREVGVPGRISIRILVDFNAGIARSGSKLSLQLGAELLRCLTKEETYNVLLHEFAHMLPGKENTEKEAALSDRLQKCVNVWIVMIALLYPIVRFLYEYALYRTAASASVEQIADDMIRQKGNAEVYASALFKMSAFETWSHSTTPYNTSPLFYAPEEMQQTPVSEICETFEKDLTVHFDFYRDLFYKEIRSRSASHPTPCERTRALGANAPESIRRETDPNYCNDVSGVLRFADRSVYEDRAPHYREERKTRYLEPLKTLEEWESNGKPKDVFDIQKIYDALFTLDRYEELRSLTDEILQGPASESEKAESYFAAGLSRLTLFDDSGIDCLYKAADLNRNYIRSAMENIGRYCCKTGNQEQLDLYREKVFAYADTAWEYDDSRSAWKKENLSLSDLPNDLKSDNLTFMRGASDGTIRRIYLIKRNSKHMSFQTYILEFHPDTKEEKKEEVYDRIFRYLDLQEEQYTLGVIPDATVEKALRAFPDALIFDDEKQGD